MACVTKKYIDTLGSWKKAPVLLGCFLCKEIIKKPVVQLKTIDIMGRKQPFSLGYLVLIMGLGV